MNEYTIRDVIIYSTEYARIDHVIKQYSLGNRMVDHRKISQAAYLLVFQPFNYSKELEKPLCKRVKLL